MGSLLPPLRPKRKTQPVKMIRKEFEGVETRLVVRAPKSPASAVSSQACVTSGAELNVAAPYCRVLKNSPGHVKTEAMDCNSSAPGSSGLQMHNLSLLFFIF